MPSIGLIILESYENQEFRGKKLYHNFGKSTCRVLHVRVIVIECIALVIRMDDHHSNEYLFPYKLINTLYQISRSSVHTP